MRPCVTTIVRALSMTGACIIVAGCGSTMRLERQRDWVALNPDAPEHVRKAVLGKKLVPGMSESAIIASWGEPDERMSLGAADARWTYLRRQLGDGVRYNVEYILVITRGQLISVQHQIQR